MHRNAEGDDRDYQIWGGGTIRKIGRTENASVYWNRLKMVVPFFLEVQDETRCKVKQKRNAYSTNLIISPGVQSKTKQIRARTSASIFSTCP